MGPYEGYNFTIIDYDNLDQLENQFKNDPNICGFFVEPVQAFYGMHIPQ